jgi:hypothetical protein
MSFPVVPVAARLDDSNEIETPAIPVDASSKQEYSRARLRSGVLYTMVHLLHKVGSIPGFYTISDIRAFTTQQSNIPASSASQPQRDRIRHTVNTTAGSEGDELQAALDHVFGDIPTLSEVTSTVYCPAATSRWNANDADACDSFIRRIHNRVWGQALWMQVVQTDQKARDLLKSWKQLEFENYGYPMFDRSCALANESMVDPMLDNLTAVGSDYGVWLTWSSRQVALSWDNSRRGSSKEAVSSRVAFDPELYECLNGVDVAQHDKYRDHVATAEKELTGTFLQVVDNLSYADIYAFYTGSLAAVFAGVAALLGSLAVVAAVLVVRCITAPRGTSSPAQLNAVC